MFSRTARFLVKHAGPGMIIQEAMYGFIMALIFVTATRLGAFGDISAINLLYMIVGMVVTWGFIDMVIFYLVDEVEHYQMHRFMQTRDPGKYTVRELLDEDFSGTVLDSMYEEDRLKVYDIVLSSKYVPDECYTRKRKALLVSASTAFLVTCMTIFPFAVCLLLIPDMRLAMTVSALFASVCLFVIGYRMGDYLGGVGSRFGFLVAGVSLIITLIATFTGG